MRVAYQIMRMRYPCKAMRIIVSADDYGLSRGLPRGIADSIPAPHDRGSVTSVSVIPNGSAFDYGMRELERKTGLTVGSRKNKLYRA